MILISEDRAKLDRIVNLILETFNKPHFLMYSDGVWSLRIFDYRIKDWVIYYLQTFSQGFVRKSPTKWEVPKRLKKIGVA